MRKLNPASIRWRLTLWYGAVLALTFCVAAIALALTLRRSIRITVDKDLRARLLTVRSYVEQEVAREGTRHLSEELTEDAVASAGPAYLRITADNGTPLYRTPGARNWTEAVPNRKNLPPRGFIQTVGKGRKAIRMISAPVTVGVVQIGLPLDEFEEIEEGFFWTLVFGAPALLLIASLGGYWLSSRALRPVDRIAFAARRITAGSLSERLPASGTGDELDHLSEVLNEMLAGLDSAFKRITQFTADASHELRTPLAIIQTTAEVIRSRARSAEEQDKAWASVLAQAQRSTQLVSDLLTLTRGDAALPESQFETVNLCALSAEVCSEMQIVAASRAVHLTLTPCEGVFVSGDSEALRRTIQILIDNAFKATTPGGRVHLMLSLHQDRTGRSKAVLEVTDTGCGIPKDDLPFIFDRFYRVSRDRSRETGGAGLGLSIAQLVVARHGGCIEVETSVGIGSTFRVLLPLH